MHRKERHKRFVDGKKSPSKSSGGKGLKKEIKIKEGFPRNLGYLSHTPTLQEHEKTKGEQRSQGYLESSQKKFAKSFPVHGKEEKEREIKDSLDTHHRDTPSDKTHPARLLGPFAHKPY
jgi:hypothetical protein